RLGAVAVLGIGAVHLQQLRPDRVADAAVAVLATTALLIAAGSLVFLFISESSSLFGFTETGYRTPIVLAIIAEGATMLLLAPVLARSLARAVYRRSEPPVAHDGSLDRGVITLRPGK